MSSHKRGKWRRISMGSVSAVRMIKSEMPRFNVLVAYEGQERVRRLFKKRKKVKREEREKGKKEEKRKLTFVGSLFDLLVVGSFSHELINSNGKIGISQGESFRVDGGRHDGAKTERER